MIDASLPVAVIGAGPIGLAAASHLIARGQRPVVLEAGGSIAHNVRQWAHVGMFSPWEMMVDRVAAGLLDETGWQHPPKAEIPTGGELIDRYLAPLASLPALRPHVHLRTRVIAVTRKGLDKVRTAGRDARPFVLRVAGPDGIERTVEAKAVIDASGTWGSPSPAGSDGLPAVGEPAAADRIFYGIPDVLGTLADRYRGKATMVVGSGHSALNALIELAELRRRDERTRIIWAMRRDDIETAFGGGEADALPARGALGSHVRELVRSGAVTVASPFRIARIDRATDGRLEVVGDLAGEEERFAVDEMIVATGHRPDLSMLREIRLTIDPWLESSGTIGPLIDPNLHSCGTVRPHGAKELAHAEKDFFIAGMKSYGRAPTFLLATGHEQVRSIVAALVGDTVAAERVELALPETGVCVTRPPRRVSTAVAAAAGGCCGGPAPAQADACCAEDAAAKQAGAEGCGCGSVTKTSSKPDRFFV